MAEKGKDKEEGRAKAEVQEPQGFAAMCSRMMAGGTPECCGGAMREMMSHWAERPRAGEGSGSPKAEP